VYLGLYFGLVSLHIARFVFVKWPVVVGMILDGWIVWLHSMRLFLVTLTAIRSGMSIVWISLLSSVLS
jgi:hypothetical protein